MARREKLAAKGRKGKMEPISKAEVRQMIRSTIEQDIEKKVTYTRQQGSVDFVGIVLDLTAGLTRGDGAIDEFTGNTLRPEHLRILASWSTGQSFTSARIIVFQWADSSVPVAAGILQYTGASNAPFSPLYWNNVPLIHVLYDELTTLFPVAGSFAATNLVINIEGMSNIFYPTGSTIPQKNGLYMCAISDDGVIAYPQFTFISELRFTDA
jgi:hypothetical protein